MPFLSKEKKYPERNKNNHISNKDIKISPPRSRNMSTYNTKDCYCSQNINIRSEIKKHTNFLSVI